MPASDRKRKLTRLAAAGVFGILALTACQALVTLKVEPVTQGGSHDDGDVVDSSDDSGLFDPCGPMPPRPNVDDAPDLETMVFATYSWSFTRRKGLCDQPGFDLDDASTQKRQTGGGCDNRTCVTPPLVPGTESSVGCDQDGGVDNGAGTILGTIAPLQGSRSPLDPAEMDAILARGQYNILVQLDGWWGGDDDPSVKVTFLGGRLAGILDAAPGNPEVWDGSQDASWILDERSYKKDDLIPRNQFQGYVAGGVLVVPRIVLNGFGPPALFLSASTTSRGRFSAKIDRTPDGIRLTHGRLAAGLSSRGVLSTLGRTHVSSDDGGDRRLCERQGDSRYLTSRGIVCSYLDLPADGGPNDPTSMCGDVSLGFGLALLRSQYAVDPITKDPITEPFGATTEPPCPDGGPDGGDVWCDDCAWDAASRCPWPQ